MALGKNVTARVIFADLRVELTAEQASWNPDVVDDMISRLSRLWKRVTTGYGGDRNLGGSARSR